MERWDKINLLKDIQNGKGKSALEMLVLINDIESFIGKKLPSGQVKTIEDARHLKMMFTSKFKVKYAAGYEPKTKN